MNKETSRMNRSTPCNRLPRRLALIGLAAIASLSLLGASAATATAAPVIRVSMLKPDHVTPGKLMLMYVSVINVGDEPLTGNLTIKYTFPAGMTPADPLWEEDPAAGSPCTPPEQVSGQVDECVIDVTGTPLGRPLTYKTYSFVDPGASGTLTGEVEVSGGGASNSVTVPLAFETDPIVPFAVNSFDVAPMDNPALQPAQAGGVPPEVDTAFELRSETVNNFDFPNPAFILIATPESFRDVVVHVPPGFVGYPTATEQRCTAAKLQEPASTGAQVPACPRDSQIGLALVNNGNVVPVYNLVPPRGVPAMFGIFYQGVIVTLRSKLRPADNGIDIVASKNQTTVPIPRFELQLWGVPAASSHDLVRADCTEGVYGATGDLCPSAAPRVPFLRMPTSCAGSLPWSMDIDTYRHPETIHHAETTTPAPTGCELNPFDPRLTLRPSTPAAHSTSGIDAVVSMPQEFGPDGIAPADLRSAAVTLPEGMAINPAAAGGLEACTDAQLGLGVDGAARCPEAAKIGSLEVETPLLDETLQGSVYIRTQGSRDPASGEMYRLALVLHSEERGVDVKLPGSLVADPATGQLTTRFSDLPQLPFESLSMHLNAGPRAPLTTPARCGTYSTHATMTSWSGRTVSLDTPFTIQQDCDVPGFAPGFEAGVANATAGGFSPFTLRVTRDSGQPNLSRIEATLPEGELAKLAGVPVCSGSQATTGACPISSRIGKVISAVGEGSSPIYLPQPGKAPSAVYLAGPYKGAPYSVVAAVPAQSGPFDLGTVVVRSALRIDPETAQATVVSDPLPQIFGGILVTYRDVRVEVDRPEFTLNPTDCEPKQVIGTIGSSAGGSAAVSDRFQVSDCAALGFKPKLSISLAGKTRRAGNPALTAVLQMPQKGANANIARTVVSLPGSEFLAQNHIQTVCTRVQYAAGAGGGAECPKGSVYGRARAFTPLLDQPLEGPVYLRSNGGDRELPDLVASLGGQIHVDLVGYIDSNKKTGGIRTTFAKVPDAPVSKFVLKMPGGKKSLLENSTNICRGKHRAVVNMIGQNDRIANSHPRVRVKGCGGKQQRTGRQQR
jgi:hypothetical protein